MTRISRGIGTVVGIFICQEAGAPMQEVQEVEAIAGLGLAGDRYAIGKGSWNKDKVGKRQVTFFNSHFLLGKGFGPKETRRNILTSGIELMSLIGSEFSIGDALFRGVKYCEPCERPSNLLKKRGFESSFQDCGGLIAEVLTTGIIHLGQTIIS